MKLRFASWNVNNRNLSPGHIQIFRDVEPDVVALQEASPSLHQALAAESLFAWGAFSLTLRPPLDGEGRSRRLGCSVFGTDRLRLLEYSLIPGLEFPERTLVTTIEARGAALTACSIHTPPGSNWGEVKPRTLKAIARWLPLQSSPLIFGIDANCPRTDHPNIYQNEWWWDDEPLLLGASPLHELKDVFRVYLDNNPAELVRVIAARPSGPLAVSHVRGKGRNMTECRYDFIYATPDVHVEKVEYVFGGKVKAVSDHAIVVADATLETQLSNHAMQRPRA